MQKDLSRKFGSDRLHSGFAHLEYYYIEGVHIITYLLDYIDRNSISEAFDWK